MYKFLLLFIAVVPAMRLSAQTHTATVAGTLKEGNGKALEGADLVLKNVRDSAVIKHTFSDTAGHFQFTDVRDGTYLVSVQLIGFLKAQSLDFTVTNGIPSVGPINLVLDASVKTLKSTDVVISKPLIENKIDKIVVNVDSYITNSGTTALDLLGTSPNVAVDQSGGSISIKGKAGAIILFDGKQTYLGGTDLINLLNSMPSSQIAQLEIMTQPPAKYDASGNSGIINIVTKKNNQAGFNANISLNYTQGVYPKSLNNAVFNYHNGKLNVFGSVSYNYNETFTDRKWLRQFSGDTMNNLFTQYNTEKKSTSNLLASAGFDYAVGAKTTIGVLATRNDSKYNDAFNSYSILQDLNNGGNVQAITYGLSTYDRPWVYNSFNLNVKTVLTPNQQLSADLNADEYQFKYHEQDNTINDNPDGSFNNQALQQVILPSSIRIYTAKADYTYKFKKAFTLESGIKASFVKTDNNGEYLIFQNNSYVQNTNLSNHFIYRENVNAAYVNYSGQLGKWSFQTGLRAEETNNKGRQLVNDQSFAKNYLQFFPSIYLTYSPAKNNTYEFSYSRRVDRPNYSDLNPFVQYVDVYTRTSGNVNLHPVFANNVEVSYNYKNSINISVYYTSINGVINPIYLQSDTSKIQLITLENVTREVSMGLSINYSVQLKNWWTCTAFYTLFNNHFRGPVNDGFYEAGQTTHFISVTQQFLLGKGWAAEMTASYRTKALLFAMFLRGPRRANTFGFSKSVLNKKGSVKLNITDPFNLTKNNYNYTSFEGLYVYRMFHEENQKVGFTFTYRFSQGQKASGQNKKNYKPEENQRVSTPDN